MGTKATPIYAREHAHGLTLRQQNAIDLLAAGKTDTEAAALLQLHRTTLTKWRLYDVEFQAALNRRRADVWGTGIDRLRALIPQALDVLARAMAGDGPDRLRAAVALLRLVPLAAGALAPGPEDSEEIVRRIVVDRRENTPSYLDNLRDRREGRDCLEDECYEERVRMDRLAGRPESVFEDPA